jgi:hypothetical protein
MIGAVSYTGGAKRIARETFCHGSDQVIFVRLTGSKPGALNSTLRLKSQLRSTSEAKGNRIVLSGEAPAARLRHFKRWCGDLRIVRGRRSFHPTDEDLSPGTRPWGRAGLNAVVSPCSISENALRSRSPLPWRSFPLRCIPIAP